MTTEEYEGFTDAVQLQMRKDFSMLIYGNDSALNAVTINHYFGNFSGYEVVYISAYGMGYPEMYVPVKFADYFIVLPNGQPIYAYKNHKFYTIEEAYNAGLITIEDVYTIGSVASVTSQEEAKVLYGDRVDPKPQKNYLPCVFAICLVILLMFQVSKRLAMRYLPWE